MSEREIKKGSIWRNVHGEVTIDDIDDGEVYFCLCANNAENYEMDEMFFRFTHEWVRDPAPEIKVGDWVKYLNGEAYEVRYIRDNAFVPYRHGFIGSYPLDLWRPCDPPPLHKALRAAAGREPYPGHSEAERVLNEIAALYRKGER